ncbi:MAG: helix-turn-helix transcriptional regulator [Verrucomicrobia bacterium]|nr:helix-turn-helix transcriptional regulator [Verrucomicrobiota bacterium]
MPGRTQLKDGPHPVDVHVGQRLRMRRTLVGLSQEKLGEALALTFQQVQKYERGKNRVSASRLFELSKILDVPVSYFFEDMQNNLGGIYRATVSSPNKEPDPMSKRETLEFVWAYYRIKSRGTRKSLLNLTRAITD